MKDDPTLINRVIFPANKLPVPNLKLNMNEKGGKTIPTSIMHYQEDTGPDKSVEKDRASQFQRFLKKGKSCNESLSRRDRNRPDCRACGQQLSSKGSLEKIRSARHCTDSAAADLGEGWCPKPGRTGGGQRQGPQQGRGGQHQQLQLTQERGRVRNLGQRPGEHCVEDGESEQDCHL